MKETNYLELDRWIPEIFSFEGENEQDRGAESEISLKIYMGNPLEKIVTLCFVTVEEMKATC